VGWDGQIVQSDPVQGNPSGEILRISRFRHSGGQFSLEFSGEPGAIYEVQASTDLTQWVPLASVEGTGPSTTFSEMSGGVWRFYRLRKE
jgi:hypothetical protein